MKNVPKQRATLPTIVTRPGATKYKRVDGSIVWEGRVYDYEAGLQIRSVPTGIKRLSKEEAVQDAIEKMERK